MISAPKPRPAIRSKPKRLPSVKCMTITVGFVCSNGIVLGADSQESSEASVLKRSVTKLTAFPPLESDQGKSPDRRAVFTGSGDSQLIDKLIEEMSLAAALVEDPTLETLRDAVEESVKGVYREYQDCFHPGYMPHAEMTYGLWCRGSFGLFYSRGPIVTRIGRQMFARGRGMPIFTLGYKASGCGNEITDYINARMNTPSLNVSDGIVLANYMLEQASEHAAGCGGDIRIIWLAEDGTAENVHSDQYTSALFKAMDRSFSGLFMKTANLQCKDAFLELAWTQAKETLLRLRQEHRESAEKAEKDRKEFEEGLERLLDEHNRKFNG